MQQIASNHQVLMGDWTLSILGAILPSSGERTHGKEKVDGPSLHPISFLQPGSSFLSAQQRRGRSAEESEVRLKKKNQVCRLFHNVLKSWNWKIYRWGRFNVMLAHNVWQWLFCPWMSRMRAAGVTPHYTAFWKGYARLSEKKLLLFRQFKMSCFSGRIHVTLKNGTKRAQRREGDFWHSWSDFQWLSSLKLENALMVSVNK